MQLRLSNKKMMEVKSWPEGDFAGLEPFIVPERGDCIIDLDTVHSYEDTLRPEVNSYKVVDTSSLYGSSKPCGPLKSVKHEKTSPFSRVRKSRGRQI
jgi:hypothetical protein